VTPPDFDQDLGFGQANEDPAVEQLIAQLAVEALALTVLPGAAGLDVGGLGADRGAIYELRRKLGDGSEEGGVTGLVIKPPEPPRWSVTP